MAKRQQPKPIPHERKATLGGSGLVSYTENRGLRSLYYGEGRKLPLSQSEDPSDQAKMLAFAATQLLRRAGEKTLDEVLAEAKNSGLEASAATGEWQKGLAEKFGFLSPIVLAAKFAGEQHKLASLVLKLLAPAAEDDRVSPAAAERFQEGIRVLFPLIYNLCDVWYWWRMEFHGEHESLLQARSTKAGRNKGAQANQIKKQRRETIITEELEHFLGNKERTSSAPAIISTAPAISERISSAVNARCRAESLGTISEDQIARAVRKIMRMR